MEYVEFDEKTSDGNELYHYGVKRRSGRYPYGSGDTPYQHESWFLKEADNLKGQGLSDTEIAKAMGMSTTDFRATKALEKAAVKAQNIRTAVQLKDKGYTNTKIGEMMGVNESVVRTWLDPVAQERNDKYTNTANILKKTVAEKTYVDVGIGVERELGVSKQNLDTARKMLEKEGYKVSYIKVEQQTNPGNFTTITVLSPPGTTTPEVYAHKSEIKSVTDYTVDGGTTFYGIEYPKSISSKRIKIRYGDDNSDGVTGSDRDGVIELRRGVEDISLGNSSYAQVRVAVDGTHYLKGMAIYSDNMPDGVDIIYNTNKKMGTPKEKVFKELKDDPDNPFGAVIKANGQRHYIDENGKDQLSVINKVKEEGDWSDYSKTLSSQFLSKQSMQLINRQIDLAYADKKAEFEEICSLTNPTVKKKLLDSFANDCDASAEHLKVAALPRQSTQVILPVSTMKDTEIYAPNYRDGEQVALVRYPHGGTFEIPILTVNNKQKDAKGMLGNAKDAVGINGKVAERLSGADFDGDTVMVLPTHNSTGVKITSTPELSGLKGFDPKSYKFSSEEFRIAGEAVLNRKASAKDTDVVKELKAKMAKGYKPTDKEVEEIGINKLVIPSSRKQMEMGIVSNLITDMTLEGASTDEICRAVRHSMVVIDAEKHQLNFKQSEVDNGISELKKKYQGKVTGGAATLISRAKSETSINEREEGVLVTDSVTGKTKKLRVDPNTGEKLYTETGRTYVNKQGKTVVAQERLSKMNATNDAYTLISDANTPQERAYADYANKMKAMANEARKEYLATPRLQMNASAKQTFADEVKSLNAQLDIALRNAPKERQAQLIAESVVKMKMQDNPGMSDGDIKKAKQQATAAARVRVGASGKESRIKITDREWEAIQAGAISDDKLSKILNHTDLDDVRKRSTPRQTNELPTAKQSRIANMNRSGYTIQEIADALGVSTSTVQKYM